MYATLLSSFPSLFLFLPLKVRTWLKLWAYILRFQEGSSSWSGRRLRWQTCHLWAVD